MPRPPVLDFDVFGAFWALPLGARRTAGGQGAAVCFGEMKVTAITPALVPLRRRLWQPPAVLWPSSPNK